MQDFLTRENLGNFTFLIFIVVAATEFTKKIADDLLEKHSVKVEYIVFLYSFILSLLRTLVNPNVMWGGIRSGIIDCILVLFNALIISYFASAGYSKITSDVKESYRRLGKG